jgi:hypothetical protein
LKYLKQKIELLIEDEDCEDFSQFPDEVSSNASFSSFSPLIDNLALFIYNLLAKVFLSSIWQVAFQFIIVFKGLLLVQNFI